MAAHSSLAVANKFLEMAEEKDIELTPMHLQKLVYIAHGWSLAILDEPLVKEPVEAWNWGPVYPKLYDATKKYGREHVSEFLHENNWAILDHVKGDIVKERFMEEENLLLDAVFSSYGDLEAFQLSALTHNEGTPWTQIYNKRGRGSVIPNRLIKEHFHEIAEED